MSGYNYNDQMNSGCHSCTNASSYSSLQGTTKEDCTASCINRFNKERSVKDQMDYNFYVKNQPMNLPKLSSSGWNQSYREPGLN